MAKKAKKNSITKQVATAAKSIAKKAKKAVKKLMPEKRPRKSLSVNCGPNFQEPLPEMSGAFDRLWADSSGLARRSQPSYTRSH